MSNFTVYLPLEIYSREYLGKLALAAHLVDSNSSVVIGYNQRVRQIALEASIPGIYYEIKGKTPIGMEYLDLLKEKGFRLVAQDEEAGITYRNWNDFNYWRREASGTSFFDRYFAWGHHDYEGYSMNGLKDNLVISGSPRTAFWGNLGRDFYKDQIEKTTDSFNEYILVVTGFATKNSLMSKKEIKNQYSSLGYLDNSKRARQARYEWQNEAEKVTIQLIDKLLQVTERKILIRPHPAEDDLPWRNRYQDNRKVEVSKVGESLPAVLGACAVFHTGSTVAFESISCGIPTFSYASLIRTKGLPMITNELSFSITSLEQLHNFPSVLSSGYSNEFNLIQVRKRIFGFGTTQSLRIQSQNIRDLGKDLPENISFESNIVNTEPRRNLNKRIIHFFRFGRSTYLKQHQHKRPVINISRVQDDLKNLNQIMSLDKRFQVEEVSESTFRISTGLAPS